MILVGGLLRVVPIWFGLPFDRARPDEETAIGHALAIVGGDLNPHFFHWPSLTFYLFAGAFAAVSWLQRMIGLGPALSGAASVSATMERGAGSGSAPQETANKERTKSVGDERPRVGRMGSPWLRITR